LYGEIEKATENKGGKPGRGMVHPSEENNQKAWGEV